MQQNEQTSAHPLIEMHLEEFRRGYQSGCAGRNPCTEPLTDQDMIDALKTFVEEGLFLPENEGLLQWHIGRLLGEIAYECEQKEREVSSAPHVERGALRVCGSCCRSARAIPCRAALP